MRNKLYVIFLFILSSISVFAAHENDPIGARSGALGGTSLTLSDVWSVGNNQAAMAWNKGISAGIFYENRFMTKELSRKVAAVCVATNSGVFGLSMNYFGYSQYNETKIGLAYAKSFGQKLSFGLQLDYLSTKIAENYGKNSAFTFEVGILYKINKSLSIGTHIFNPIQAKISDYNNEKIPAIFRLGLTYTFSPKVFINVETEKDINQNPVLKGGVEYHMIKPVYVRIGISSNPTLSSFGFGVEFNSLKFDFASTYHQTLGFTPQVSLIYSFGNLDKSGNK
jgi:hypothetical protein